tara:strand:- start:877 stop:1143 length:267 start_codon:yes stop_codon:yes gene_type:complete
MKIGIIGASGTELAQMKAVMAKMGHEIIVVSKDDIDNKDENELTAYCGHPSLNVGIMPEYYDISTPKIDNSFRGGSIGKGGKIKYRRS